MTSTINLSSGERVTIESITSKDYVIISGITKRNFLYAPNFNELSVEDKLGHIKPNSASGIRELCEDKDNICSLAAKTKGGNIAGYVVARKEGRIVAKIARIHVDSEYVGQGVGRLLLERFEQTARQIGYIVMNVLALGKSSGWFERRGYRIKDNAENASGGSASENSAHCKFMTKVL
ncbi:MAG: GNAT family N-acetyltransferase [Nanoarchaeota archaeon]|nr:GNAT family N-acetyltransferase [Nanoarchaeota archaeon]